MELAWLVITSLGWNFTFIFSVLYLLDLFNVKRFDDGSLIIAPTVLSLAITIGLTSMKYFLIVWGQ